MGAFSGMLLVPFLIGYCVDAMSAKDWDQISRYCTYMAVFLTLSSICAFFRAISFRTINAHLGRMLHYDLFNNIINKDITFFEKNITGDILSRLNNDCEVVEEGFSNNVFMFLRTCIGISTILILMFFMSWKLTLVSLGGVMPLAITGICFRRKVKDISFQIQQLKAQLGLISQESISNIRTVKAFSTEKYEATKFKEINV